MSKAVINEQVTTTAYFPTNTGLTDLILELTLPDKSVIKRDHVGTTTWTASDKTTDLGSAPFLLSYEEFDDGYYLVRFTPDRSGAFHIKTTSEGTPSVKDEGTFLVHEVGDVKLAGSGFDPDTDSQRNIRINLDDVDSKVDTVTSVSNATKSVVDSISTKSDTIDGKVDTVTTKVDTIQTSLNHIGSQGHAVIL